MVASCPTDSCDFFVRLVVPSCPSQHDAAGIVGMATNGQPHSANTQFYIALEPLSFLDGKRVAFGKVLTQSGEVPAGAGGWGAPSEGARHATCGA